MHKYIGEHFTPDLEDGVMTTSTISKTRTLLVTFKNDLSRVSLTAFRAAIIEKVGREHLLFHNHLGKTGYNYKYPLIQYKRVFGQPAILLVGDGVEEIQKLFSQPNWDITIKSNIITLEIEKLGFNNTLVKTWENKFTYQVHNWQALNAQNFERYQELESLTDKVAFLEGILKGNILSFAKGINCKIDKQIFLVITAIRRERVVNMKEVSVLSFDLNFTTNVSLPEFIGLGKGAGRGFGTVRKNNKDVKNLKRDN